MNDFERRLADQVERATPPSPPPYDGVLARLRRRRMRRRAAVASVGAAVLVAAVIGGAAALRPGSVGSAPPSADRTTSPPTEPSDPATSATAIPDVAPDWNENADAPPVFLQLDGREVPLKPWTACYGNLCFDGMPQPPYADAGDRAAVEFSFPLKGWTFEATFRPAGHGNCHRAVTVPTEKTGTYTFQVPEAGPPGDYLVELFGRGNGGDVVTTFAWTTTARGIMPEPDGFLAIVSGSGGERFGYAPELSLNDLARTPSNAKAVITVTAGNGESLTLPVLSPELGCLGVGSAFFRGPDALGAQVVDLGPPPYAYSVDVTLDGRTHTGTGSWPADEIKGNEPYVALDWSPPLPAWTGD